MAKMEIMRGQVAREQENGRRKEKESRRKKGEHMLT
jgi:hypothetical protein